MTVTTSSLPDMRQSPETRLADVNSNLPFEYVDMALVASGRRRNNQGNSSEHQSSLYEAPRSRSEIDEALSPWCQWSLCRYFDG